MTTEEKLNAIAAKCRAFLEITEKRTPGEWRVDNARGVILESGSALTYPFGTPESEHNDAAFIAACAGPAEAMSRSTIAAIELLLGLDGFHGIDISGLDATRAVIAAWPDELLETTAGRCGE